MALLRCAGISDLRLCCLADSRSWPSGSHPARAGREVESDRGCGRWYRSSWVGPSINVALIAVVRLERTDIIFCGLAADRKSTSLELQSLMRISYAVFCLKKKNMKISISSLKTHNVHRCCISSH